MNNVCDYAVHLTCTASPWFRIHVERYIGRLKSFHMLDVVPRPLMPWINEVTEAVTLVCRFLPPLVNPETDNLEDPGPPPDAPDEDDPLDGVEGDDDDAGFDDDDVDDDHDFDDEA